MKEENKIIAYKGFDKDLKCRYFQYEVGKAYEMDGEIECCECGFHACENPLDVFGYYAPADSRYCKVEQSGTLSKDADGSKVASSKIRVQCEIGMKGIIEAGVKFIFDKVNWKDNKKSNTGNRSAATNTGYRSAATNTGNWSAAKVSGEESIAIVTGSDSMASGALGCWLVLTERDENYHIKEVKAVKVDGKRIKADTYYKLVDGEVKEVV